MRIVSCNITLRRLHLGSVPFVRFKEMPVYSYEVVDCTINPVQNYYLSVIFVIGIVQLNSGVNEKEAIPLLA